MSDTIYLPHCQEFELKYVLTLILTVSYCIHACIIGSYRTQSVLIPYNIYNAHHKGALHTLHAGHLAINEYTSGLYTLDNVAGHFIIKR